MNNLDYLRSCKNGELARILGSLVCMLSGIELGSDKYRGVVKGIGRWLDEEYFEVE